MATPIGAPIEISAGNVESGSQSITVPAGANFALVFSHGGGEDIASGFSGSIGGQPMEAIANTGQDVWNSTTQYAMYVSAPPMGAQTLTWSFPSPDGLWNYGSNIIVVFFENVNLANPIGEISTDVSAANPDTDLDASINVIPGQYIIAGVGSFNTVQAITGMTELANNTSAQANLCINGLASTATELFTASDTEDRGSLLLFALNPYQSDSATPQIIGSIISVGATGADPVPVNVDVPAGAKTAVIFYGAWIDSATWAASFTATLGGESFTLLDSGGIGSPGPMYPTPIGVAILHNPPTGTQSLDYQFDADSPEGPLVEILFLDSTVTVLGVDVNPLGGPDEQNPQLTVNSSADGLVLGFVSGFYRTSGRAFIDLSFDTGITELKTTATIRDCFAAIGQVDSPGAVSTLVSAFGEYPGLVAISFASSGAGDNETLIQNVNVFNTGSTASQDRTDTITVSYNHTAGNKLLVFAGIDYQTGTPTVSLVEFDGIPLSVIGQDTEAGSNSNNRMVAAAELNDPPVGLADLTFTLSSGTAHITLFVVSLSDAGEVGTPVYANIDEGDLSLSIPSSPGDLIFRVDRWRASSAHPDSIPGTSYTDQGVNAQDSRASLFYDFADAVEADTDTTVSWDADHTNALAMGFSVAISSIATSDGEPILTGLMEDSLAGTFTIAGKTTAGDNRLGVVTEASWSFNNNTIDGVTWGGVAMTRAVVEGPNGDGHYVAIWTLENPPTAASDIVFDINTDAGQVSFLLAHVHSYKDVDLAYPIRAVASTSGAGSAPSVSVVSESRDLVLDVTSAYPQNIVTPGAGQTYVAGVVDSYGMNSDASRKVAVGASTTMSWAETATDWSIAAISIRGVKFPITVVEEFSDRTPLNSALAGWTSSEFTPPANSTLLLVLGTEHATSGSITDVTVSNTGGLAFAPQIENGGNSGQYRVGSAIWSAKVGSSPSPMTITIEPNGANTVEYRNYQILSLNGFGIVADSTAIGNNTGGAGLNIALSSVPVSGSFILGAAMMSLSGTYTHTVPGTGFSEISQTEIGGTGYRGVLQTQFKIANADSEVIWADLADAGTVYETWAVAAAFLPLDQIAIPEITSLLNTPIFIGKTGIIIQGTGFGT